MTLYDPDYQYGYRPYIVNTPIPKGKHRVQIKHGKLVCIAEKHPTCNYTDKRTIMTKKDYIKNYKKKDRIK